MPLQPSGGQPLTDQVYATLSRRISDGAWKVEDRLPSERHLAEELGVCRVTVARAMNRLVSEGVLLRRRGSGTYVADRRSGAEKPVTGAVALVVPFGQDSYISHIVKGAAGAFSDAGYHILFHDTHADWRREAHQIQRLRGRVDGFLVFPADGEHNQDVFSGLLAERTPLVFLDRYYPSLATDWVVTDNYQASLEAVRRLIAEGRRHIVHITTPEFTTTSTLDRRLGFCQALLEAGRPVRQQDIRIATETVHGRTRSGEDNEDNPGSALSVEGNGAEPYGWEVPGAPTLDVEPLIRSLLQRDEGLDAIFALNDWTLLACLHALHRLGARVPEDVAVAGFADNDLLVEHLPVPILAVSQPKDEIGRQGAEILIDRMRGDASPARQVFLSATVREAGGSWARPPVAP